MKKQSRLFWLTVVFVACVFRVCLSTNFVEAGIAATIDRAPVPISTPTTDGSKTGKVTTSGGLTTVTFEPKAGTVRVYLPDDMRAGDTISGTAVAEPKGQTPEDQAKNKAALSSYTLELRNPPVGTETNPLLNVRISDPLYNFTFTITAQSVGPPNAITLADPQTLLLVLKPQGGNLTPYAGEGELPQTSTLNYQRLTPNLNIANATNVQPPETTFQLPTLGQQGRPIEIFGPFDGNASNTTLRFGPPGSTIREFVKASDSVEGGFGVIKPLAESPRKLVFEVPVNLIGPIELNIKDGNNQATGTHRNVGVRLSAPKTSLLKGEKTTLTTEVSGLQGITKAVPLTLTSEGVITMEGGPFQQLMIKPSEVNASGKYTTTRQVTGIMAGGWGATATVVTGHFNIWLQDDSDPNRLFHFNSFTGDYIFACGGGSCRNGAGETSSQPPTGSSVPPPPVTLTGIGKPQMKGCIITLSHNAPDRRVFARLDACTKSGDASVETKSPKANISITDKNTTDNTTQAPPK